MTCILRLTALAGLLTSLSACSAIEPYDRAYTWRPTGANEANLAAMAADPKDLVHGRGTSNSDGQTAAVAVDRLRRGKVKPLSDGNSTTSVVSGAPSAAAADSLTAN